MRRISHSAKADPMDAERRKACLQWGLLAAWPTGLPARAADARRIVSVGGALTEIVFALQANADLVGVDTTSLYPESAQKLPSVGYARSLSVEGVLALAPTQVIATEDAGPPAVLRQLSAAGIPVAVLAANHRFEGLIERVRHVGALTGRAARATALQQRLQQEWAHARAQVTRRMAGPAARVLFVLAHAPNQILVAGTDTSAQAMLEYAASANAIDGFSGYKPLTPEAVIAAQPDIVLLTDQGLKAAGGVTGILKLPGLGQTPAGHKRRVIALEAMLMLGFGPRLPAAVSALHAAIEMAMRA
ncbi:heme/hemin ABC transporter substrate-binding protein [Verminephrobacter eiseniae]|uniref:Periplasmic binding protein n=1 Tax=Verminephrobacter eiseniae (strain EF01-2) TaxID=391735 RepID=A1WMF6_VEREI|nr:ABC transporter substrate-binding protein [Verminephrobacter eiseniae]ABM58813.1 periplasmic binding protein [Verminephrobacter eiseniae EF01-2]MCW5284381.1 hemin ABC transporter substrate-binding protein [Verminephrobacter eiseniae]MCW5302087.1 hemin ABC transporter substrate-binding protein [Verminephrobacter eiseniae]MCW8180952.1 hemin ABC transporter substrate-binding protein [Verminephrobacter eiseniae]MCW8191937.1 hemin ABC transporter substrate-binding protein [Verminephrobacter eise